MMYIAHDSDHYGYLQQNGHAIPDEAIARRCGATSVSEYLSLLSELDAAAVPSRTPNGIIFSRRMVRDERERSQTADRVRNYRKGQGNGNGRVTPQYEGEVEERKGVDSSKTKPTDLEAIYKCYPRKVGRGKALKAITKAFQRLLSGEDAVDGLIRSYEDVLAYIVARVQKFAQSPAGQAGEYTPHPATWLNDKRYLDDDREWQRESSAETVEICERCRGPKWIPSKLSPGRFRECDCKAVGASV